MVFGFDIFFLIPYLIVIPFFEEDIKDILLIFLRNIGNRLNDKFSVLLKFLYRYDHYKMFSKWEMEFKLAMTLI